MASRNYRRIVASAALCLTIGTGSAHAQDAAGKKIGIAAREITNDYNRDIIAGAEKVLKAAGAEVEVKTYPGIGHPGILLALGKSFRGNAPALDDIVRFARG